MQADSSPGAGQLAAGSPLAPAGAADRPASPPDHLQLDELQWALFAACFTHVGPGRALRRLMARNCEALLRAGLSPPAPFAPEHDVSEFDCGEAQLNNGLQVLAQWTARPGKRRIFVIAAGRRVVGYYAVRPGTVARSGSPPEERIPVAHLRLFAVDRRWANKEIAADLFAHLAHTVYAASREGGARALFGYPISAPVRRLYRSWGTRPLPRLVDSRAMLITIEDMAAALRAPDAPAASASFSDAPFCHRDRIARSERFVLAEAADQFHLLNIDRGSSVGISSVGARIWTLIAAPVRFAEICSRLQSEFEVDPAECERDVVSLLDAMRRERMIAVLNREAAVPP